MLGGLVLQPTAARFSLPLARLENEYIFCRALASALDKNVPSFNVELFYR